MLRDVVVGEILGYRVEFNVITTLTPFFWLGFEISPIMTTLKL